MDLSTAMLKQQSSAFTFQREAVFSQKSYTQTYNHMKFLDSKEAPGTHTEALAGGGGKSQRRAYIAH